LRERKKKRGRREREGRDGVKEERMISKQD
jgi:hypothetical protein